MMRSQEKLLQAGWKVCKVVVVVGGVPERVLLERVGGSTRVAGFALGSRLAY